MPGDDRVHTHAAFKLLVKARGMHLNPLLERQITLILYAIVISRYQRYIFSAQDLPRCFHLSACQHITSDVCNSGQDTSVHLDKEIICGNHLHHHYCS